MSHETQTLPTMKKACAWRHTTCRTAPANYAIQPQLLRTLYRKTLHVLAHVERCKAHTIAERRWAEFIPSSAAAAAAAVLPREGACRYNMKLLARCCFEQAGTRESVRDAFEFIKESSSSLALLEVLTAWDALVQSGPFDLTECLCLMSAALSQAVTASDSASADAAVSASPSSSLLTLPVPGLLEQKVSRYRSYMNDLVGNLVQRGRAHMTSTHPRMDWGSIDSMNSLLTFLRSTAALQRRDVRAEDFSLVSALREGVCAEYVLNLLLHIVLTELGFHASLVGVDLVFRWVRVTATPARGKARPIFVSWSHGAYDRAGVARRIRTADTQWFRATANDARHRCGLVCALLRKQLSCISVVQMSEADKQRKSVCTELLLHTLSLQH